MNQKQALEKYLKNNKAGITVWTAQELLGITRLSQRVIELEQEGKVIHREVVKGVNRYGNSMRITRYKLVA